MGIANSNIDLLASKCFEENYIDIASQISLDLFLHQNLY